ncbi:hypothetical protein F52700_961 [Fusarium sp. NRRL 52700]|nr:hypothetical protein F52700_961 [Fusarium sp. NRRL 52700]
MSSTYLTKLRQTTEIQSLVGLSFIHALHGYRVCYPIFWDISCGSFTEEDKVRGLQRALAKLETFDYDAESSNGWSFDQKLWGIGIAIVIIKDILSSPDFHEAFCLAQEEAESWVEHDSLLKPGMTVAPYISTMQEPLFIRQTVANFFPFFKFNLLTVPEHLMGFASTFERSAPIEGLENKKAKNETAEEPLDEIANRICKMKLE